MSAPTSTGKRRSTRSPKRAKPVPAPKRKRARTRARAPAPKRKRKPAPKRKRSPAPKRKPPKRKRSPAPKRKPPKRRRKKAIKKTRAVAPRGNVALARKRAAREAREGLEHGLGDVEVIDASGEGVRSDYRAYPIPDEAPDEVRWAEVKADEYRSAMDWLEGIFGPSDDHVAADEDEIEWFPTFDEVYDYIDALVDEYDLDAHELFELAFGYATTDQA